MTEEAEVAIKAFTQTLTNRLYDEAKSCAVGSAQLILKKIRRPRKRFSSVSELILALDSKELNDGTEVIVVCKPTMFGFFLKNHLLLPIIGDNTELRLGPRIAFNEPIMGMFAQMTSHLAPVGLYPQLEGNKIQAIALDPDTPAIGFTGIFPPISNAVKNLPCVIRSDFSQFLNFPCELYCQVRVVEPENFLAQGISLESWEVSRQNSRIWFLDASGIDAQCKKVKSFQNNELWGGLYSSGHLEIESEINVDKAIDAVMNVFSEEKISMKILRNSVKNQEIMLYGPGIRLVLVPNNASFSIHMDAELSKNYGEFKEKFDRLNNKILAIFAELCERENVKLNNEFDLDFSYTNSAKSFTILRSQSAEQIADPLAIAVRDWLRKKNLISS